jgi:NAD(P)-dependent dehydrogenase (short-subunit alcohol dehydrogenase family)
MNVNGMRCLVVGGARGLGAALALGLAEHGADVVVSYHSSAGRAEETCAGVRALGRLCATVQADLTDAGDAGRLVGRAAAELGGLDALVYVASGPFVPRRPDEVDEAAWSASLDTIAKGFFFTAGAAYRALMADPRQRPRWRPQRRLRRSPSIRGVIVAITDVGSEAPSAAFAAGAAGRQVARSSERWPRPGDPAACEVLASPGPSTRPTTGVARRANGAAARTVLGRLQRPRSPPQ